MSKEQKHIDEFDDFLQRKLKDYKTAPSTDFMNQILDATEPEKTSKTKHLWLYVSGVAAAIFLIVFIAINIQDNINGELGTNVVITDPSDSTQASPSHIVEQNKDTASPTKTEVESNVPAVVENNWDYILIKVNGKVSNKSSLQQYSTGDTIYNKEELTFSAANQLAYLRTSDGVDQLMRNTKEGIQYEDMSYTSPATFSTRGTAISNAQMFVKLLQNSKLTLLEKIELDVNASSYPLTENAFFYVAYQLKGEIINKQLKHQNQTLTIERNTLYEIDGKALSSTDIYSIKDYKLYYMDKNKSEVEEICKINLYPISTQRLKREFSILLNKEGISTKEKREIASTYLQKMYGLTAEKTDLSNFLN